VRAVAEAEWRFGVRSMSNGVRVFDEIFVAVADGKHIISARLP